MPFIKLKNQGEIDWYESAEGACALTMRTSTAGRAQRLVFHLSPEDAEAFRKLVAPRKVQHAQEG